MQISEAEKAKLERLVGVILAATDRINLTGDRDPALFWARHIVDAVESAGALAAAGFAPAAGARVLDVGSGAGLPGLAWAVLWPEAQVTVLDSRKRRVEFLREAIAELGLENASAALGRAELLAHEERLREQFDLVAARGLARLPTLWELTAAFAKVGGRVAAIKSAEGSQEEIADRAPPPAATAAAAAPATPGGQPRGEGKACVVVVAEKVKPTPAKYPRREGLPGSRPVR